VTDTTPRCVDCGTVYCCYREEAAEWVCSACWTDRNEVADRWPA